MKKCEVEECSNLTRRKKYCEKHYKRWLKYGSPLTVYLNKGKTYEEFFGINRAHQIKEKMSKAMIGKFIGDKNPAWKGERVGYFGLHYRIKQHKRKPIRCAICKKKKKLVLANKSGKYKTSLDDWMYVCYKCHMKYDGYVKPKSNCPVCNEKVSRVRNVCCSRKCKGIMSRQDWIPSSQKYLRRVNALD